MKVLFLSHKPHEVHLEFAKSIGAKIKITGLNWFVVLYKKIPIISYTFFLFSFIYSFFIKIREDILLVEGGSSLYVAVFLKIRYPKIKIIFLDSDLLFYNLSKQNSLVRCIESFYLNKIDAVISVSQKNRDFLLKILKVPNEIVNPYPKQFKKTNIKRKNYGLYVGRLDPDKNIKRIVNFGLQCPYFKKFIIVGDGAYKNYIKRITKKNKKILFLGEQENLSKIYNQCKFFIHIPDYDPHPCTTMEAALGGCFPIITESIGTSYMFDDVFIIKDPENFWQINQRIKYILKNEKKAKNLLRKSIKKFPTKQQSIKNFKKSFNSLIKKIRK